MIKYTSIPPLPRQMKIVSESIGIIFLLFCIAVLGCTNKNSDNDKELTIREVEKLDKTSLINLKASVRSRDRGDDRIVVTNHNTANGAVLLKIDENCTVFEIDYNRWNNSTKLDLATTTLISKCLCEIGLNAISVDSCGNAYFSVSQVDKYEFVVVENESCLDTRFRYSRYQGKCYRIRL